MTDETERRNALRERLAERDAAREIARGANDAHTRALANLERATAAVNRYGTLDAAIEQFTVDALRDGDSAVLPDAMADQVSARQLAVIDLVSADRAVAVLRHELTEAIAAAERCDGAVRAVLRSVTDIERGRLRDMGQRLKARGEAILQLSAWGDLSADWQPICDALLADPLNAPITIADADLPDEPVEIKPPPPPVFIAPSDEITIAGTGEKVTMAELQRRHLLAMRPRVDPTAEAIAVEAAIRQTRRLSERTG
jgi:hypothetical protein